MMNEKEYSKVVAQNLRNIIFERGGWSTPHVMQKVYRHALADKVDPMALKAVSAFQQTFQVE